MEVRFRAWSLERSRADKYRWNHHGTAGDIVEYRVAIEQTALDAAAQLLRANDYTVIPPVRPLTFEDVVPMTEAPPEGARYWVISASDRDGVYSAQFGNDALNRLIRRRMAYLNKEHALIAAKHIFGLKGGEL